MKVYLLCVDAVPWGPELEDFAARHQLTRVMTLNNGTFTLTSTLARFTGRLPGDLVPRGIGKDTWRLPRFYHWQRTAVSLWRWLDGLGWRGVLHNCLGDAWGYLAPWAPPERVPEAAAWHAWVGHYPSVRVTNTHPQGKYEPFCAWPDPELCSRFYRLEREYVRELQSTRGGRLLFHANHCHWHDYVYRVEHLDPEPARRGTLDWLSMWDMDEPDALFWIFSDHGHRCGVQAPPPDHCAWTLVRDNTARRVWSPVMAGQDFYRMFADLVGRPELAHGSEARCVFSAPEPDRIYFVEDARCRASPFESITFGASTVSRWSSGGDPLELTQLTWLPVANRYAAFRWPAHNPWEYLRIPVRSPLLDRLREALKERFPRPGRALGIPLRFLRDRVHLLLPRVTRCPLPQTSASSRKEGQLSMSSW
ncbi:MAG: hypothetical protein AB1758_16400 [Candidatus Eremiobacterota bacterium]